MRRLKCVYVLCSNCIIPLHAHFTSKSNIYVYNSRTGKKIRLSYLYCVKLYMFSYSTRFLDLGVYYLILGEIIFLHITFTRTVLRKLFPPKRMDFQTEDEVTTSTDSYREDLLGMRRLSKLKNISRKRLIRCGEDL